jgi:hypothetical protein
MAMIMDPMAGRDMQSSESESYCMYIILASHCSNILLSIAQGALKIYKMIKELRSKNKVTPMNAVITESPLFITSTHQKELPGSLILQESTFNHKNEFIEEKMQGEKGFTHKIEVADELVIKKEILTHKKAKSSYKTRREKIYFL